MLENVVWLSESEKEYIASASWQDEYPNLQKTLKEPQFKISSLGISPRDASYWDKQGVLPDLLGKGAMRRYNLVQAIWIRFIPQMRNLGISLTMIKKLKENIFNSSIDITSFINSESGQHVLREIGAIHKTEDAVEEFIRDVKSKKLVIQDQVMVFESILKDLIVLKKDIHFLVDQEGNFHPYTTNNLKILLEQDYFNKLMSKPHFSLSIQEAYNDIVLKNEDKPFFQDSSLLSNSELKVLDALRQPNIKSVNVRFKNGEIDLMELTEEMEINLNTRYLDIVTKNGFNTITIKSRNGKPVYFENKISHKL